jgi:opacity protein-like surface antigen
MKCSLKYFIFSVVILSLLAGTDAIAQGNRRRTPTSRRNAEFLEKQWWIGVRGGWSYSKAKPGDRYSVFSSTEGEPGSLDKKYNGFKGAGAIAGLELTFTYKTFSLSFQPNYRRQRFSYSNSYEWKDTASVGLFNLQYKQDHQLDYLELPLLFKYDILKNEIKPYVQAGCYYGILSIANKKVEISGTDQASGGTVFKQPDILVGAKDLFIKSSIGFLAGAGVSYDVGNVKVLLDVNYRFGTNTITNRKNRYTNNALSGAGDALDDVKLRNISINLGCLLPMRYVDTNHFRSR